MKNRKEERGEIRGREMPHDKGKLDRLWIRGRKRKDRRGMQGREGRWRSKIKKNLLLAERESP